MANIYIEQFPPQFMYTFPKMEGYLSNQGYSQWADNIRKIRRLYDERGKIIQSLLQDRERTEQTMPLTNSSRELVSQINALRELVRAKDQTIEALQATIELIAGE